ncbi:protein FAM135 [Kipferlia bialata]|uniref:Protein FAM135 n=1 Tax=Kipferlia bialata TaxID=797122 RepID=A0A9K3CXT2_9EUKA|nr:protein FAM135 [Kipferlia bialata]|eukprot:g5841.t1
MALSADLLILLNAFSNIDLYEAGVYAFKVQALNESGILHPLMYANVVGDLSDYQTLTPGRYRIDSLPPTIAENSPTFYSQPIQVKYCDQFVPLSNLLRMRVDLDADSCESSLILVFSLLYHSKDNPAPLPTHQSEMEVVSRSVFRVRHCLLPGASAFTVTFDDTHFCALDVMLTCSDPPMSPSPTASQALLTRDTEGGASLSGMGSPLSFRQSVRMKKRDASLVPDEDDMPE